MVHEHRLAPDGSWYAEKVRLLAEVNRLQSQTRRSRQERDQLDNLLAASNHKNAQQELQLHALQVCSMHHEDWLSQDKADSWQQGIHSDFMVPRCPKITMSFAQ